MRPSAAGGLVVLTLLCAVPPAWAQNRAIRTDRLGLRTRPVSMELMTSCGMPEDNAN